MIVNGSTLRAAAIGYKALFFKSLENPSQFQAMVNMLSLAAPSNNKTETYAWLGQLPNMAEWIGERPLSQLKESSFAITNKKWANGIEVDAEDLEDDNLGIVKPRIMQLAEQVWYHKMDLIMTLINNGSATACYDGQNFFSATHSEGSSGTQVNYGTSKTLNASNYHLARYTMMKLKGDRGQKLGIAPTHLWCVPELEDKAREILNADIVEDTDASKTNIWKGTAQLLVIPFLSATNAWGLLDNGKALKPFITQEKRAPRFMAMEDPSDEAVFMSDVFRYGADYRGNAGYGLWQLMSYYTE